jgi:Replication protein C N-terminal domain
MSTRWRSPAGQGSITLGSPRAEGRPGSGKFRRPAGGGQIAGAVVGWPEGAAPRLGISPRIVHAVDWLFRFTQPQDWEPSSRPIVWPSASMQEEALGLSATQVRDINRRLIEDGLITMKDSPNGKRYGGRHEKTGRIIEAYGFDLAPLAARHTEFLRLTEEGRAERAAMGGCGGGRRSPGRRLPRSSRRRRNTVSRARSGPLSPTKQRLSCVR